MAFHWLVPVVKAASENDARQAFRLLHDQFSRLRADGGTHEISQTLQVLSERSAVVHPLILVGALRSTYLYRSELADWAAARTRIAGALRARDLDIDILFVGLTE